MEAVDLVRPAVSRHALMTLEAAAQGLAEQLDLDDVTTNWFAPGVYARQIHLPAGSLVLGKIHKHAHLNLLLVGLVEVASEFHTEMFAAPRIWVSEPGIKRAVRTVEDAMWVTIHPNPGDGQDMGEIEDEVIAPTYEQLDSFLAGQLEKLT